MNVLQAVHPLIALNPETIVSVESFRANPEKRNFWGYVTVDDTGAKAADSARSGMLAENEESADASYLELWHDEAAAAFCPEDDCLVLSVADLQKAVYMPSVEAWLMPCGQHLQFYIKTVFKP